MLYGILGLIHVLLVIFAALSILKSSEPTLNKAVWILIVLAFPLVGLIVWWFIGPKG